MRRTLSAASCYMWNPLTAPWLYVDRNPRHNSFKCLHILSTQRNLIQTKDLMAWSSTCQSTDTIQCCCFCSNNGSLMHFSISRPLSSVHCLVTNLNSLYEGSLRRKQPHVLGNEHINVSFNMKRFQKRITHLPKFILFCVTLIKEIYTLHF